jgi:hypothetical protein
MKISEVRAQSLHVEANSRFSQFANVSDDEKLGSCLCLCGICNKAYFVTEFCQQTHKLYWDFGFSGCKLKGCCIMLEEV